MRSFIVGPSHFGITRKTHEKRITDVLYAFNSGDLVKFNAYDCHRSVDAEVDQVLAGNLRLVVNEIKMTEKKNRQHFKYIQNH